ncbi:MAG: hypothetical protein JSU98_11750 [Gemmatimonadales bacterium]|nr:MAG: hypothetical protein JSU98_11750 [Gemmatimonadales bacterium]
MHRGPRQRRARAAGLILGAVLHAAALSAQQPARDTVPTLGLDGDIVSLETPSLVLDLVAASHTVAALRPADDPGFDFTPSDWLGRRAADGYYHLGDLTLRIRAVGDSGWGAYSTAAARAPVTELPVDGAGVLAAADLTPTLPADLPLRVSRSWEVDEDGVLTLRFRLRNRSDRIVELGAVGFPMVFNNILHDRSLEEAHAVASFHDPYVGMDAGYLQVTRLSGRGSALLVVPLPGTPFEAYNPLLDDPTRRGITFEGFYEWLAHSGSFAEHEWRGAEPWNPPTTAVLEPGEERSYGVQFILAPSIRGIEETLAEHRRPVVVGVPGYVAPRDVEAKLFIQSASPVSAVTVDPPGSMDVRRTGTTPAGRAAYSVRGRTWGRSRLTLRYEDGQTQTVHYRVIEPTTQVADSLGRFLTNEQWYEDPDDLFGRSPAVISYDYDVGRAVTEDNRAWIAGLGDEGGSGSWLAAFMKQLVRPEREEIARLERFVDGVLWGGLQYAEGELKYGVRKSLFYYEPDSVPPGTYSEEAGYGGWSSWSREHAATVGRSYDYPHVAAAHWVLYRLARNHVGLVRNHEWEWYLDRAFRTGLAMVEHAPHYAQFGQMDGTVFLMVLQDLQREGWQDEADELARVMRARAEVWRSLPYPYGSEMPWDSTGQEEVYAWSRYFGFREKAEVTLRAILGYMPTLPHWGYNGSARRYWDFLYAGKLRRLERQLHHYGSGLNALPVLTAYRDDPQDLYLLRVGYGGVLGAVSNVTRDGFGPAAFHAFPGTLRIDGYSGDFGMGYFGHVVGTGTFVHRDADLGWLAFGGEVMEEEGGLQVRIVPRDVSRSRVYLGPLGLWVTLDAGTLEAVVLREDGTVTLELSARDAHTPSARVRVERPGSADGPAYAPRPEPRVERGTWVVPLGDTVTRLMLAPRS